MKVGFNIFTRVIIAFLVLALIPLTISSLLVVRTYESLLTELSVRLGAVDPILQTQGEAMVREATILVSLILLITVIITIFASLYLSRSISLPIRRLLHAFSLVSRGQLDVRMPVRTNDEFGELGRGFNAMVRRLSEYSRQLEETNTSLEQHVGERTAELRLAYERLQRTADQINEANRIKSEFVANMSHELRTPLVAIQGFTDLALEGMYGPLPDKLRAALAKISTNSKNLQRQINDVLDLSKIEAGRLDVHAEDFDLGELIHSTAEDLRPLFDKKGLSLAFRQEGPLPTLHQDAGKIGQILLNLLSNAQKFTERGGVTVFARREPERDEVRVDVVDTGVGIPREQWDAVFDPFRQLNGGITREQGGTGLGLALVRQLAELLGGEVGLESEQGVGSKFWFALPVRYDPAHSMHEIMRRRPPTVLAVDDDPGSLGELSAFLEPAGFLVSQCFDARQGIAKARDLRPDAVLVDELMPGLDGWAFVRELRDAAATRDIPVVMIVNGRSERMREDGDVRAYWSRPFARADRLTQLRRLTEHPSTETDGVTDESVVQEDLAD